jgi:hypothetical protein
MALAVTPTAAHPTGEAPKMIKIKETKTVDVELTPAEFRRRVWTGLLKKKITKPPLFALGDIVRDCEGNRVGLIVGVYVPTTGGWMYQYYYFSEVENAFLPASGLEKNLSVVWAPR